MLIKVKGIIESRDFGALKICGTDKNGVSVDFYFNVENPYDYQIGSEVEASGELLLGNIHASYCSHDSFEVVDCEVKNVA